jgi:hypothetical protein
MKLYLDSMFWIYYFEGHTTFGPPTQSFVNRMRFAHHEFLSSNLILAEVLVVQKRNGDFSRRPGTVASASRPQSPSFHSLQTQPSDLPTSAPPLAPDPPTLFISP